MSSVDYPRRKLTHACSRSDTDACDMCCVFNVNLTEKFERTMMRETKEQDDSTQVGDGVQI